MWGSKPETFGARRFFLMGFLPSLLLPLSTYPPIQSSLSQSVLDDDHATNPDRRSYRTYVLIRTEKTGSGLADRTDPPYGVPVRYVRCT